MTFNTREKAIMDLTLALTFNTAEVKVCMTIDEAIKIYYHTCDLLRGKNIAINECKAIHVRHTNEVTICTFDFN